MTAILSTPQDKRERLPGIRDQVREKVITRLNYLHSRNKLEFPEMRSTIRDWVDGLDPDDFYRQSPFADLILNPPVDKTMATMYDFHNRLDRKMTQKAINEWVNNLIASASNHLYPGAKKFWRDE